jgi:hypothetical protein
MCFYNLFGIFTLSRKSPFVRNISCNISRADVEIAAQSSPESSIDPRVEESKAKLTGLEKVILKEDTSTRDNTDWASKKHNLQAIHKYAMEQLVSVGGFYKPQADQIEQLVSKKIPLGSTDESACTAIKLRNAEISSLLSKLGGGGYSIWKAVGSVCGGIEYTRTIQKTGFKIEETPEIILQLSYYKRGLSYFSKMTSTKDYVNNTTVEMKMQDKKEFEEFKKATISVPVQILLLSVEDVPANKISGALLISQLEPTSANKKALNLIVNEHQKNAVEVWQRDKLAFDIATFQSKK